MASLQTSVEVLASLTLSGIVGIVGCCHEIEKDANTQLPTFILTDSQAVLKSLRSYVFTSSLMLYCHDKLQSVASQRQVSLIWIPGHSGDPGNEKTDLLARTASETPFCGPEPGLPVPLAILQGMIDEWKDEMFANQWRLLN